MRIKFKKIIIKNFRNIEYLELNFNEKITEIIGENGLGKTNSLSAIYWCLFGKDIVDNKLFVISPIINGVEDNSINTNVKLYFDNDYIIERNYINRKTTIKTGWLINDDEQLISITQTNFNSELKENFVDENTFKSLNNINYLTNLNWKDLKKIIFDLVGDISDDEILLRDDFFLIEEYVRTLGIEKTSKLLNDKDKSLSEEIKILETKYNTLVNTKEKYVVDEQEKEMLLLRKKQIEDIIYTNDTKIKENNKKREIYINKQKDIDYLKNEIKNCISLKESKLQTINDYELLYKRNSYDVELKRQEELNLATSELQKQMLDIKEEESIINQLNINLMNIREQGIVLKQKEIKVENETCSMCHQKLSNELIEQTLNNLRVNQLRELEKLHADFEMQKEIIKNHEKTLSDLSEQAELQEKLIESIKVKKYDNVEETDKQKEIRIAKEQLELQVKSIDNKLLELNNQLNIVEVEFNKLEMPSYEDNDLLPLRLELDDINEKLATSITLSKINDDIDIVISEINKVKDSKVETKDKIQEVIKFNNLKADLLQKKLESHFKLCSFRTRETTLNGEEVECFKITTKDNITIDETNTANKILMSIDLINGIQKLKNTYIPIIIDGVEVITKELVCDDTQLIITRAVAGINKLEII